MKYKDVELIDAKAEGQGIVTALASVFGNIDRQGEKVLAGSFKKTLRQWRQSGRHIPVIFNHGSDNAMNFVGSADPHRVRETAGGLEVEAELDVDENPVAKQVYNLLRKRALPGWSFGFRIPPGGKRRRDGYTEISEVELFEVGPTLVGANPEARTLAVKAFEEADQDQPDDLEELRARSLAAAEEALAARKRLHPATIRRPPRARSLTRRGMRSSSAPAPNTRRLERLRQRLRRRRRTMRWRMYNFPNRRDGSSSRTAVQGG